MGVLGYGLLRYVVVVSESKKTDLFHHLLFDYNYGMPEGRNDGI